MDPSSSIEAQASMNSNQPEATRTIIGMDPALYDAAANGKFDVFEDIQEPLDLLRTPTENTILHIYLTTLVTESGSTMNFVEKVLHKCPSLLRQTNANELVGKLLERLGARSITADHKGWTPLHIAAYLDSSESAKQLLKFDRHIAYMKDAKGRTALHIAAHRGNSVTLEVIISSCPDCCELVDNRGRNALHTAILGGHRQRILWESS
ncbi:Serine/threonine-protein phosphatase 6 regulatory ankyrin repeat subunit A [Morella rubra]|uniref:Serine/threonine-protein phosphatase 6 regulatory ankyrin repeat subunit A n=1 Tax=Morella rubra TaxID=262757 RepID=A0A6A1V6H5_9ROSI|nr:Serine/threonine-protein phosphatase 6 regulatory ankyrin repeat subunit A [Morella rubra]